MIKVRYSKVNGRCMLRESLTSGMVGQPIHFEYSHDFDGLAITAVFTDGKNTVNVVNPGNECIIPHEVLTTVGATVKVGIYAVRGEELVIPTVYATIGIVLREFKTGQVQVLERMEPMVINTHDSWKTLELVDNIT